MQQYSDEDKKRFVEALGNNMGHIHQTCVNFGISRKTFYNWKKDEWFADLVEDTLERKIDNVESALMKQALEGNVTAQIFFLKTQAKHRGYVEKTEISGDMNVSWSDDVLKKVGPSSSDKSEK